MTCENYGMQNSVPIQLSWHAARLIGLRITCDRPGAAVAEGNSCDSAVAHRATVLLSGPYAKSATSQVQQSDAFTAVPHLAVLF